jgi:exopolyphosphatase/guanosine-5'-triphosphate,3'-diphosphate pyrophosphatase
MQGRSADRQTVGASETDSDRTGQSHGERVVGGAAIGASVPPSDGVVGAAAPSFAAGGGDRTGVSGPTAKSGLEGRGRADAGVVESGGGSAAGLGGSSTAASGSTSTSSSAATNVPDFHPVAVIDIGTSSIRMAVAEIDSRGRVHTLEELTQAVSLGKDTFTSGSIGRAKMEECVRVLKAYRRVLSEYRIEKPERIRVVATSAVREARNRLAFIDRVYIATGLQIEPLDEAEENRVTYLSVNPFLQSEPSLRAAKTLVVEVGGGSTEILVVRSNNVLFSHTYRLGSLRLRETLDVYHAPPTNFRRILDSQIERVVSKIHEEVQAGGPVELLTLGGDMRFAATLLGSRRPSRRVTRVPLAALEPFVDSVLEMTEDEIARKYRLPFPDAETLGPALRTYTAIAKAFGVENLLVSQANLRDGLLKEMALAKGWSTELANQIFRSAIDLGRRYHVDEAHARHVAELCSQLFRELRFEHHLDPRQEILLRVAALLHEIGLYISYQSHHKHAAYIIRNSDLFGLSRRDVLLISQVARYYRRASPQPGHEMYSLLERDERVAVCQMAALLRVAVALDDSRSQRVKEVRCFREEGRIVLVVPNVDDLSLEQLAIRQNGAMFEDVFGLQVLLRPERGTG